MTMKKADRIAFVKAGLRGYELLNAPSKARTSREAWIAFKLGCSEAEATKYIREAETHLATNEESLPDGDPQ